MLILGLCHLTEEHGTLQSIGPQIVRHTGLKQLSMHAGAYYLKKKSTGEKL